MCSCVYIDDLQIRTRMEIVLFIYKCRIKGTLIEAIHFLKKRAAFCHSHAFARKVFRAKFFVFLRMRNLRVRKYVKVVKSSILFEVIVGTSNEGRLNVRYVSYVYVFIQQKKILELNFCKHRLKLLN